MAEVKRNNAQKITHKKKRRRGTLRLSVILLIFIACIVISFIYYYFHFDISSKLNPDFVSRSGEIVSDQSGFIADGSVPAEGDASDVTAADDAQEEPAAETAEAVKESARKDDSYLEKCAFIGDSITSGFASYRVVPVKNVFAAIGLRTDTVLTTTFENPETGGSLLLDGLNDLKPESVYIMLGSNGIAWADNDQMIDQYGDLIDKISETLPDAQIYIMSVTPVGSVLENSEDEKKKILNTQIDSFNLRLSDLASRKEVVYLDINTLLKGSDGKLPEDISRDGMHINKSTYEKIIEYILTHTV